MVDEVSADPDELLTGPQIARLLEITPGSWRVYVSTGVAPRADEPDEGLPPNRRNPKWKLSTVRAFVQGRKGQGYRSDRR